MPVELEMTEAEKDTMRAEDRRRRAEMLQGGKTNYIIGMEMMINFEDSLTFF